MDDTVLISFNWKTDEVVHTKCRDELEAFSLLATIRDDFPESKGWGHYVLRKSDGDALRWLVT